jgi:hypothetical protein
MGNVGHSLAPCCLKNGTISSTILQNDIPPDVKRKMTSWSRFPTFAEHNFCDSAQPSALFNR